MTEPNNILTPDTSPSETAEVVLAELNKSASTPGTTTSRQLPTTALSSWFWTVVRMLRGNPGVGHSAVNPAGAPSIRHSWLWLSAPLILLATILFPVLMSEAVAFNEILPLPPLQGTAMLAKIYGVTIGILLIGRALTVFIFFKWSGLSLKVHEALDLGALSFILAPFYILIVWLLSAVDNSDEGQLLSLGILAFFVLLTEIGLFEAIRQRGNLIRTNLVSYVLASTITFTVCLMLIYSFLEAQFRSQYPTFF